MLRLGLPLRLFRLVDGYETFLEAYHHGELLYWAEAHRHAREVAVVIEHLILQKYFDAPVLESKEQITFS